MKTTVFRRAMNWFAAIAIGAVAAVSMPAQPFAVTFPLVANFNPVYSGTGSNLTAFIENPINTRLGIVAGANQVIAGQGLILSTSFAISAVSAIAANIYFEFTVAPKPGYAMTLDVFSLDATRSGGGLNKGFTVRNLESGYYPDFWPSGAIPPTIAPAFTTFTEYFTNGVVSYSNLTHAVTFRFYVFVPSSGTSISVRNLAITGRSVPIPAPVLGSLNVKGNNLVFRGTNGLPGAKYYLLASADPSSPMPAWARIRTNSFDEAGDFVFTNVITATQSQRFFRLQVQ